MTVTRPASKQYPNAAASSAISAAGGRTARNDLHGVGVPDSSVVVALGADAVPQCPVEPQGALLRGELHPHHTAERVFLGRDLLPECHQCPPHAPAAGTRTHR